MAAIGLLVSAPAAAAALDGNILAVRMRHERRSQTARKLSGLLARYPAAPALTSAEAGEAVSVATAHRTATALVELGKLDEHKALVVDLAVGLIAPLRRICLEQGWSVAEDTGVAGLLRAAVKSRNSAINSAKAAVECAQFVRAAALVCESTSAAHPIPHDSRPARKRTLAVATEQALPEATAIAVIRRSADGGVPRAEPVSIGVKVTAPAVPTQAPVAAKPLAGEVEPDAAWALLNLGGPPPPRSSASDDATQLLAPTSGSSRTCTPSPPTVRTATPTSEGSGSEDGEQE